MNGLKDKINRRVVTLVTANFPALLYKVSAQISHTRLSCIETN